MMQLSPAFHKVNALTQEQRDAAYNAARRRIAGEQPTQTDEPQRSDFDGHAVHRFPKAVTRTVTALSIAMLVVAFLPSAMRLNAVALDTNFAIMTDANSVYLAALATVMMAEIGQMIFSLAAAVNAVAWQRLMLLGGALVCTLIALSGNAVAMGTHATQNLFAFLETFAPPVLVLITAQILKTQMLHATEAKYAADRAFADAYSQWQQRYQTALADWNARFANANELPEWNDVLANALRDALRAANRGSKAVLRELTIADWRALVLRERSAEEWWKQAETEAQIEAERIALEEERIREAEAIEAALAEERRLMRLETMRSGTTSTNATGEVASALVLREADAYIKVCPECGERFAGDTLRQATNRLVAHMKKHRNQERKADALTNAAIEEEDTQPAETAV